MVRVGIPPPYSPLINDFDCFVKEHENETILRFVDNEPNCLTNPGYSIEIVLEMIRALGHRRRQGKSDENVTFVSADGWGWTAAGRGMIEMVGKGEIDMTIPMAMTYKRHQVADYTSLVGTAPPNCYMVCGTSNLLRMSSWGIVQKLVPTPYLLLFLFVTGFALLIARWVQNRGSKRESSRRLRSFLQSVYDVTMVRETDQTSIGILHNFFVSSIFFLVYMNGMFAGNLVETFAPKREFPFRSIRDLAEGVHHGPWRFRVAEGGNAQSQELLQMQELKEAIKTNPIEWFKPPLSPEKMRSKDIVFESYPFLNSYMKKFRYSSDCICDPIVSSAHLVLASSGTSKSQKKFTEDLSNAVEVLAASGFLARMKQKYITGARTYTVLSTQSILGNQLSMVPVEVSLSVFYIPFVIYCGFLLLSICVFLVEILVKDNLLTSLE